MADLQRLVREASGRLKEVLRPTPLVYSSSLSARFGFECYLKLENLQKTGSFKVRGAYNRISTLTDEEERKGIVTASSGNHAQGVAWASTLLGVRSTIVMPENAPIIKRVAARGYGGEVVSRGASFDEALGYALSLASEKGLAFIQPFDDEAVIAGQGTVWLEVLESLPDADTVVVPVGGGGLIAGIAAIAKEARGDIKVIGVEAEGGSLRASLEAGRPVPVGRKATIADGIAVKRLGEKTFPVIRDLIDGAVTVGEDSVAGAILALLERKKLVAEGAGAAPLAAAIEGKVPASSRKVVFIISGGNIDVTTLDRVIRLGLMREGRVIRISTVIPDEPGALARLATVIASLRANILHMIHQREAVEVPVGSALLEVVLEVEGPSHSEEVTRGLRLRGYEVS